MSVVLDAVLAEMDEAARALLRRLAERDEGRGWNEPLRWPGRSPEPKPGEIWASGEKDKP